MYPMGDEKYDLSSFSAIASVLRIGNISSGRRRFFRGERKEDVFEAHARRPELEEPPSAADDRAGEVAADVASVLALHLVPDDAVVPVGFDHPHDAGDVAQHAGCAGADRIDLHIQGFRSL